MLNIENKQIVNLEFSRFMKYLQLMNLILLWRGDVEESLHPYKLMWYFKLYFIQNNMHQIGIKY